jgi:hypothetical protein
MELENDAVFRVTSLGHAISPARQHYQSTGLHQATKISQEDTYHSDRSRLGADGHRLYQGVEERTIKLMESAACVTLQLYLYQQTRARGRDPIELLDEVESVLKIRCAYYLAGGMGRVTKGVFICSTIQCLFCARCVRQISGRSYSGIDSQAG